MERWEAACIWLLFAIPTQHTDVTACAYFILQWDIFFYCKMFHIIHLIRLKFQIAVGAKWSFSVWPVTGLRDMLLSCYNYCLKASHLLRCRVVRAASWVRSNFRPPQSLILKLKLSVFYTLNVQQLSHVTNAFLRNIAFNNLFSQVGAQVAVIIVLLWLRRTVELKFPLRFLLIH